MGVVGHQGWNPFFLVGKDQDFMMFMLFLLVFSHRFV
jgi:hypothetical protein